MAPIRVGIIGLSAKGPDLAPGAWASTAILPSFRNNPAFEITALCNSTIEAAQRSIAFHNFPSATKAYGNPTDLANDPNVDLVVVSVFVGKHLELTLPAIEAKKYIYVEWPLGATTEEAEQMTKLAKEKNLRTMIGLQGRGNPIIKKAREIVRSGEIGEITNTSVVGAFPLLFPGYWLEGIEAYLDITSGGNTFKITFAHFLDSFLNVVGDVNTDTLSSIIARDVSEIELRKWDHVTVVNPSHPKTAPEHVLVQGKLQNGGAPFSISFRTASKTLDDTGVRWIVTGTKGEIEITANCRDQWQIESGSKKLRIRSFETGDVREYDVPSSDLGVASGVPSNAVNTALIVDGFAKETEGSYVDFAESLKMHKLLDIILEKSGYLKQ